MKLGDDETELGGKETGPVAIDLHGDQRRGQQLIGPARTLLGKLKQRMQFNEIKQDSDRRTLPTYKYLATLFELLCSGEWVGQNIPIDKAKKTYIEVTVNSEIEVSSIKGYGAHPDQDKIIITVQVQYQVLPLEAEESPEVIGFSVHFKSPIHFSPPPLESVGYIEYFVAEPFGTSGNGLSLANPNQIVTGAPDDFHFFEPGLSSNVGGKGDEYTQYSEYPSGVTGSVLGTEVVMSGHYGKYLNWKYHEDYLVDGIYPPLDPPVGIDWYEWDSDLSRYTYTAYSSYMVSNSQFNHVDTDYSYEQGYAGKFECRPTKEITEETVTNSSWLEWMKATYPTFMSVNIISGLHINKWKRLLPGWYGIGVNVHSQYTRDVGVTFVFYLNNGIKIVHTIDFTANDTFYGGESTIFLFNAELGLLNQYSVDSGSNPFTIMDDGEPVLKCTFQKEPGKDLKLIKSIYLLAV